MDSATCAAWVKTKGYRVIGLSIVYGQKHKAELKAAENIARTMNFSLYRLILPPDTITGSALLDGGPRLPKNRTLAEMQNGGVAPSYVPARNMLLIALAAAFAEAQQATAIYYGAHREDHVGYPDCRPEFVAAMGLAVRLGTAANLKLEAPFIEKAKSDIVYIAHSLQVPLELSLSCYQGLQPACGVCDTCVIRIHAFKQAGLIDPIPYERSIDWGQSEIYSTLQP
jgi:7-cyano-7-deazaguanine synthase